MLLKLFEDDEKAASSANKRPGTVGRASQSQRENKKTVGLQVREWKAMQARYFSNSDLTALKAQESEYKMYF